MAASSLEMRKCCAPRWPSASSRFLSLVLITVTSAPIATAIFTACTPSHGSELHAVGLLRMAPEFRARRMRRTRHHSAQHASGVAGQMHALDLVSPI